MKNNRQKRHSWLMLLKVLKRDDSRHLIENISLTFITQVLSAASGVGLSIFISRTLGTSGQGQYALTILLGSLLTQFFNLGVPSANVYFVGREEITPQDSLADSLLLSIFLILVGGGIGLFIIFMTKEKVFQELPSFAIFLSLCWYGVSLIKLYLSSILQSIQCFSGYNKVVLLSSISTVLIAFLLVNALKLGFISFVVSSLLGNLFGLLLCYFLVRKNIQQEERPYNLPLICPPSSFGDAKARIKRICRSIKYGYKIAFSNIVASLNYRIDILLISYFLGVQAVGIYVVAVQIAEKLWFFSQSASTVLLPKLAAFYKSENEQMSEKAPTLTVFGLTSLFTLLSAMVTAFLSPRFIPLLFGADFDLSATVLFFLLPGVVFLSASRIFANDIAARGHPELNLYSSVLVLFSNAALNVLLIGKYGVIGAAVATSVAYAMNALFKTYTYLNYSAWFERSA